MTLLGHVRKRLKSRIECKLAIHHLGDPVLQLMSNRKNQHDILGGNPTIFRDVPEPAAGLAPGGLDHQLTKMTLLGHMRKRLKSLVECKFAIHHRGDPVLLDETIHVFEIFA
jgi:hypothetical protein